MKLKDKVAIVTGSGGGMGRAIALRFAKEGAKVVIAEIDPETGNNKVADEIKAANGEAIAIQTDVKKGDEVNRMVKAALNKYGKVDISVNNVGVSAREKSTMFHKSTEEIWDFVIATCLKSAFHGARAVLPHMMEERSYVGRFGEPEDVANLAAFLASDEANWITGQNIPICGGESLGWGRRKGHFGIGKY